MLVLPCRVSITCATLIVIVCSFSESFDFLQVYLPIVMIISLVILGPIVWLQIQFVFTSDLHGARRILHFILFKNKWEANDAQQAHETLWQQSTVRELGQVTTSYIYCMAGTLEYRVPCCVHSCSLFRPDGKHKNWLFNLERLSNSFLSARRSLQHV